MAELGAFAPGAWAARVAPHVADVAVVVLPASPDGRDLAPRLAHRLGPPLLVGAVAVHAGAATVSRRGGLVLEHLVVPGPFVATLEPGVRGVEVAETRPALPPVTWSSTMVGDSTSIRRTPVPPGERRRPVVSCAASVWPSTPPYGATRVVTDAGWAPVSRQIGTTGVTVDPDL